MSLTSACASRWAPNSFAGSAPYLDAWLLRHFDPENVEATIEALTAAQGSTEALSAQLEAARRTLADCDERLAKYRTVLEAGTDPVVVTAWLSPDPPSNSRVTWEDSC